MQLALPTKRSGAHPGGPWAVRAARCRHEFHGCLLQCLGVFVLLALLPSAALAQTAPVQYAQADIAFGSQIFKAQCTACHGANGDSVPGVNFRAGQFRVPVSSDFDLRTIITTGVAGTAMPSFNFDTAELTEIIAYLRNMSAFDARGVTMGDAERGQALFEGKGKCANCHRVNGKGPRVAPDLSDVGATRTADLLEKTLLDPTAPMLPVNRSVRAVTKDGKVITGRRLNEDTYTVQLIDEHENLVALDKADLREYTVIKTSSMPPYKDTFSSQEIADVLAYLFSLKGSK
jgi:putative heme-binding domain-containing protein